MPRLHYGRNLRSEGSRFFSAGQPGCPTPEQRDFESQHGHAIPHPINENPRAPSADLDSTELADIRTKVREAGDAAQRGGVETTASW